MSTNTRRQEIALMLSAADRPLSGSYLAEQFNISRQIIVSDIAVLKSSGYDIISTHSGYVLNKSPLKDRVFKLKHSTEDTFEELSSIINLGGTIVDVFVWHKVYGRIVVPLNIYSAEQVRQFIDGVRSGKSTELMNITGGYHYHTVRANSEETLDKIEKVLERFIVPEL